MRRLAGSLLLLASIGLVGCGIQEKIEQRVAEEVTEKAIEIAADGEVDVETRDGKISIEGKNGEQVVIDEKAGTTRVVDENGKVIDYAQGADGSATMKGSDGLDASFGTTIPADFPISLPAAKQIALANRTIEPDGSKSFLANFEAESRDAEALAKQLQAALEGKGLTVARNEVAAPEATIIQLNGTHPDGKIESMVMLSAGADAGVGVTVTWVDRTAVAP